MERKHSPHPLALISQCTFYFFRERYMVLRLPALLISIIENQKKKKNVLSDYLGELKKSFVLFCFHRFTQGELVLRAPHYFSPICCPAPVRL